MERSEKAGLAVSDGEGVCGGGGVAVEEGVDQVDAVVPVDDGGYDLNALLGVGIGLAVGEGLSSVALAEEGAGGSGGFACRRRVVLGCWHCEDSGRESENCGKDGGLHVGSVIINCGEKEVLWV